jgi:hypothetical protein
LVWTTPAAIATNEAASSSKYNSQVKDNLLFLYDPPRCRAYRSAALSIANDSDGIIAFDAETIDNDGIHSNTVSNSRFTIQTTGRYRCVAQVAFANDPDGYRTVQILRNGVVIAQSRHSSASSAVATIVQCYEEILCTAADYLEVQVRHTAGASLALGTGDTSTFFHIAWTSGG